MYSLISDLYQRIVRAGIHVPLHVVPNINSFDSLFSGFRGSAFRARSLADQRLSTNTPVRALFEREQFDLNHEYNSRTSEFIPKQDGVYFISGSVAFEPDEPGAKNYRIRLDIYVNGESIAADNDFFGTGVTNANVVTTTTIWDLKAGDRVKLLVQSGESGVVLADGIGTHFEAARLGYNSK